MGCHHQSPSAAHCIEAGLAVAVAPNRLAFALAAAVLVAGELLSVVAVTMLKVLLWFLFCRCRLLSWVVVVVGTKCSSWSFVSCSWITAKIDNRCD